MPWVADAKTLLSLGWPELCRALAERAQTARGRGRAMALPFLDTAAEVTESLARVEEARLLLREEISLPAQDVSEVGPVLMRAAKGSTLAPLEILACGTLIRAAAASRRLLSSRAAVPALSDLAAKLPDLSGLAGRIEAALEPNGEVKDTASDTLLELRTRLRSLHQAVKDRVEAMLHDPDFSAYLQDTFYSVRNDRYVLPIKASYKRAVPGIVHNASQSGQTLFVEPQALIEYGNELAIAASLALEEERQILSELSGYLGDRASDLEGALGVLAVLDLAWAGARLAVVLGAEPPVLGEVSDGFVLEALRHPLLLLQGKRVVPSDVRLSGEALALVVSGPNAGGKTVTLTAVALCALLLRAGLPTPASKARLPLWEGVAAAIGDAQDLRRDLSTFSAHLTALKDIVATARPGLLAVIDEIAADTDPKEGAALAVATLEALATARAHVLVSTHLDEVKALGLSDARFLNARMGFAADTLKPTYVLELGAPGVSNALAMASQVGLPASLVARAQELLTTGGALSLAIERLHAAERQVQKERGELEKAQAALAGEREQAGRMREEADAARREAEMRVREELKDELMAARAEVKRVIASLQASPSLRAAQAAQKQLDKTVQAQVPAAPAAAKVGGKLKTGSRVQVASLGQVGEVIEVLADEALVQLGSARIRVNVHDLAPAAPQTSARKAKRAVSTSTTPDLPWRIDVRGQRGDEALREVERFLDQSTLGGTSQVVIVHGHGTGALKRLVREALARLPYVETFRPGGPHEGGDGVTVVDLVR